MVAMTMESWTPMAAEQAMMKTRTKLKTIPKAAIMVP
jgi:hypothetical protein